MSMDGFKDMFRDEALEILADLENTLLALEEAPDRQLVDSAFRSIHTVKGSAAMFGFEGISRFAHEIETCLEVFRNGTFLPERDTVSAVLACRDFMLGFLVAGNDIPADTLDGSDGTGTVTDLLGALRASIPHNAGATLGGRPEKSRTFCGTSAVVEKVPGEGPKSVYRIRFSPGPDIFRNGTSLFALLKELSESGEYSCIATEDVPPLSEMDPLRCYFRWDVLLTTALAPEKIREVFMFTEANAEIRIDRVMDSSDAGSDDAVRRLGSILVERGVSSREQVERAASKQKKIGALLVEDGIPRNEVHAAVEEQKHIRRFLDGTRHEQEAGTVRIVSGKLDDLVDLAGELVTVQARLSQISGDLQNPALAAVSEQVERLTASIRDAAMGMRMMPIGSTFSRFRRLVRDLSHELGKDAELVVEGGETELDKAVIEKLNDPLVHLIRNSMDHGLGTPEERKASGKSPVGTITLSARHSNGSVLISVKDDGRGINAERIRETAVRKGLMPPGTVLSESELHRLLFLPGFSTASCVTSVSGRGVGMDVVKRNVESLGGAISLHSEPGKGTEFLLRLPLTLAIIDGLLVEASGTWFVIPLSNVEECVRFDRGTRSGDGILDIRGRTLPFLFASSVFGLEPGDGRFPQMVVVSTENGPLGLVVDDVIGNCQTVIKSMGKMYGNVEGISGAAVLGDGRVALIMDTQRLSTVVFRNETDKRMVRSSR